MSVSINVLDGTSYVVEARLKVVAWVGVGVGINVLDRTSYVVEITLGYWCFNGFVAQLVLLAVVVVEHSALEVDRGGIESNGGAFTGEAIHNGPKLLHLHRSHPNTWGCLPSAFEIVVAWSLQGQIAFFTCQESLTGLKVGNKRQTFIPDVPVWSFCFTGMFARSGSCNLRFTVEICNVLKLKIAQDKCQMHL